MKRKWLLPVALTALWALVLTWPLAREMAAFLPLGSERSPTVPLFNLWTLGWNVNRLVQGYADYWDAPIFHPVRGAFAFSEPQPLAGLLAAPFWPFGPAVAYNAVILLFLVMNGLAAYGLLRRLGLGLTLSTLGGLLAQALPVTAQERGVLQLVPFFGPFLALTGLYSLREELRWSSGLMLGLGLGITFLTSENYALFLGLLLIPAAGFWLRGHRNAAVWRSTLLASLVAIALILPLALKQVNVLAAMDFRRGTRTITTGSALPVDYLGPSSQIWESEWWPFDLQGRQRIFPGVVLIGLAAAGCAAGLRKSRLRGWTLYLIVAAVTAFVLSFGLNLRIGGWQPYGWFRAHVPGFDALRSPFRLAYFVHLYFWLLAALCLLWLERSGRRAAAMLLVAVALLELFPRPARLTPVPSPIPAGSLEGPAIFLPFPPGPETSAFIDTTTWMAATLSDPVPLANGYSGYFPRWQSQLRTLLSDFPTRQGVAALRALGIKTIYIQDGRLAEEQADRLAGLVQAGDLVLTGSVAGFEGFRIAATGLRPISAYDGEWVVTAEIKDSEIEMSARPAVTDDQVYLMAPEVAPLQWQVQVAGPGASVSLYDRTPAGGLLFYRGSDRSLHLSLPRPGDRGSYTLVVSDALSGRKVFEATVEVP